MVFDFMGKRFCFGKYQEWIRSMKKYIVTYYDEIHSLEEAYKKLLIVLELVKYQCL